MCLILIDSSAMTETINTYPIQDPETLVPMDRNAFYAESIQFAKEGKKPVRSVEVIQIFLFNSRGEVMIQKRAFDKAHNAGLLDKSLGGHVQYGNSIDYSVMVETLQELQTPSIVLKNKSDFEKTFGLLKEYLHTIAVLRHIESDTLMISNRIGDSFVEIAKRIHVYFGIYDGRIRPADGEAKGVLWYSIDDLKREMAAFPDTFTQDLHVLLRRYESQMRQFLVELGEKK